MLFYSLALDMDFPQRHASFRKHNSLTQQTLAEKVGVPVIHILRYESGSFRPTLDVIRKLAIALSVSTEILIFGRDRHGPDDEIRLHFEIISQLDKEEKIIKAVHDGLILKREAMRWSLSG